MQSKCVELISRKMKPMEVLLDMVPIVFFTSNEKKINDWLAVTSEQFYFIYNNHIKKTIPIADVRTVTVSAYSHEIVLHCDQDDIRFSSHQNAKIFKNILKIREQVLNNGSLFTVLVEKEKHLGKFAGAEEKKKSFLSSLFSRHGHESKKDRETRSSSSSRNSYCKLQVTDKTFLHQVSQKIYACHYSDVKLLYISGGYGFFFDQSEYDREEVDSRTYIYRHRLNKEEFVSRKILKENQQASSHLRSYLQSFKLNSNKEEILYAIQQKKYFQIISPYSKNQRSLQSLIEEEKQISEIDLVSIFYKLMGVIDNLPYILYSLRPRYILLHDSIIVSSAACLNKADTNVNYLAPEELDPDIVDKASPQLINLWKLGVLLYEIAYLVVPFPIEHLAEIIIHNKNIKLAFPSTQRSPQFKHFIGNILQIDPAKRAGGRDWKRDIFQHRWLRQSMR